jgi:hypothetical protein
MAGGDNSNMKEQIEFETISSKGILASIPKSIIVKKKEIG